MSRARAGTMDLWLELAERDDARAKKAAQRLEQTSWRIRFRAKINERRIANGLPPLRGA